MKKTGEFLKAEREKQGISLNEISMSTKISVRMLKAIEAGDLDSLPAKTFLRGFVQSYSSHLRIDVDKALEVFHSEMGSTLVKTDLDDPPDPAKEATADETLEPPTPEKKSKPQEDIVEKRDENTAPSPFVEMIRRQGLLSKLVYVGLLALLVFLIVGVRNIVTKYEKESMVEQPKDLKGLQASSEPAEDPPTDLKPKNPTDSSLKESDAPEASSNKPETTAKVDSRQEPAAAEKKANKEPSVSGNGPLLRAAAKAPEVVNKETDGSEQKTEDSEESKAVIKADTAKLDAPKTSAQLESSEEVKSPPEKKSAAMKPASKGPNEVIIEALDEVSIEFRIGSGELQRLTLGPDQVHTIKAETQVRIDFSDGGAVNITHNGRDRGVPGDLGKPKKVVLP